MSTALLDTYHFDLAAKSLGCHAMNGRSTTSSSTLAAELCRAMDVPVFGDDDAPKQTADHLMLAWKKANALAYAHRYGEKHPRVSGIKRVSALLEPVALLKALQCIRYNCDGGAPLALDNVIEALQDYVITSLPEYEQAKWFITRPN